MPRLAPRLVLTCPAPNPHEIGVSSENLCDILAVLYDVRSTLGREKVKSQNSEAKQACLENQVSKVSRARGIRAEGL